MAKIIKEDKYGGLRAVLSKFSGRDGLRRRMLDTNDKLGIEKMRLEICEAAQRQWEGKTSYRGELIGQCMAMVFTNFNGQGSLNCGECLRGFYKRMLAEIPAIKANIAKIEARAKDAPQSDKAPQAHAKPASTPTPPQISNQQAFIVTGGYQTAAIKVCLIVQRDPLMVQLLDPIDSEPMEAPQDRVFMSMVHANHCAQRVNATNVEASDSMEKAPKIGANHTGETKEPEKRIELPAKGMEISNGVRLVRVTGITKHVIKFTEGSEKGEITIEEFKTKWAIA